MKTPRRRLAIRTARGRAVIGDWRDLIVAEEQHQERDAESGKGTSHLLLWTSFVLIIYVLSVGPAAVLHEKTSNARLKAVLRFAYAPVGLVEKTPLKPVIKWWIKVWHGLASDGQ
jgi:hypothetical protein